MKKQFPAIILDTIRIAYDTYGIVLSNPENLTYFKVNLNCSSLPSPTWKKGELQQGIQHFWKQIAPFDAEYDKKACLYYFEINSPDTEKVLGAYKNFRNNIAPVLGRNCPTLKKYPPVHSNVLYVGKVKKGIGGRMYVHLGYYHIGATAGLQLESWGKDISLDLTLHIYAFNQNMYNFIDPLELPFARSLNPLIGKH